MTTLWEEVVPTDLLARAYAYRDELAWTRPDALQVVLAVEAQGFVVIGVDIWIPTPGAPTIPTPNVYDWSLEQTGFGFGLHSPAFDFIDTFAWEPSDNARHFVPVFNLCVSRTADRTT